MKYTRKNFTMIEVVLVISVMLILLGLALPGLQKAKFKAKSVRWIAYNNGLNRDPDLVLNFNFQNPDTRMDTPMGVCDVVLNGAVGCGFDGFKPVDYNAVMMNATEWRNSGRWKRFDNSMVFDGFTGYLEVPGKEVLKLYPGSSDFTVAGWVKFDVLSGIQTVISKSVCPNYTIFMVYALGNSLNADVGSMTLSYTGNDIVAGQWTQFALVADGRNLSWYVNGRLASSSSFGTGGKIVISHDPGDGSPPHVLVVSENGWNGHKNHANDYIISTDPNEYWQQTYIQDIVDSKVLVGAAGMQDAPPSYFFKGGVDEIIVSRRAWTSEAVNGHFEMGNPN